ncbi:MULTISPECIES: diaminopimelate epimerase [Thermoactinomyces]|jgi:diaminopimelate epimerase|uniref:Diaminopimelate epimerase n=1 Tax=Thermoactinomyces daqus TaxID=1329516 RepID=A0A7W1X9C7_9BACL|nr:MULTISPECIES: diaminopimelate epimerase [Thermoactinomyces]MBA4542500.1 diaminopimelate epimerase [Thermoactinomyces daqus]MBH8598100.1 diaminopimelate epimerase [Thermoactinomyces sp. CICC 10523]MBH8603131.1 diaminopimelate epimerase [Thermoactinomyces sp. CICC 10522]
MKFTKMHGLGNDFIIVYQNHTPNLEEFSRLAVQMCHRHTGIGADGLVVVYPSENADAAMRIFNADGSLTEQCGNAMRCVAKYCYERLSALKDEFTLETKVGLQTVWVDGSLGKAEKIRVDMGEPVLEPSRIPVVATGRRVINQPVEAGGAQFYFTGVSMGNPHAVIEVDDASRFPVEKWGPILETHRLFPNKSNVEFVTFHSPSEVTMRVWERGVGQTMACGSGACATLVAGVLLGKLARRAVIHLLGGDLEIEWSEADNRVYMSGPAAFVYDGVWLPA